MHSMQEIKAENKKKKLQALGKNYFIDKTCFDVGGLPNCLIFTSTFKCFTKLTVSNKGLPRLTKELTEENIIAPNESDNRRVPKLNFTHNAKIAVKFEGSCFKLENIYFIYRNAVAIVYLYVVLR